MLIIDVTLLDKLICNKTSSVHRGTESGDMQGNADTTSYARHLFHRVSQGSLWILLKLMELDLVFIGAKHEMPKCVVGTESKTRS